MSSKLITLDFEVGQVVWFLHDNWIAKGTVHRVSATVHAGGDPSIVYQVDFRDRLGNRSFPELKDLWASQSALIQELTLADGEWGGRR